MRAVDRLRHDRARGARGERRVDELVAVVDRARHRDEQVARPDLAAVEGDPGDFERRARRAAGRGRDLGGGPQRAHAAHSRATSASSNGSTRSPMIWPVSWPLPATSTMSPARAIRIASAIASRRPAISVAPGAPARIAGADLRRVLAARIVVGDDDQVGQARRDRAHLRPLALVAVAAGAEHGDQPAFDMRPKRRDRRLERVGRVGVIDIDRSAAGRLITARSSRPRTGDTRCIAEKAASHSPPVASTSPAATSTLAAW